MARTEGQWHKKGSSITPSEDVPVLLKNDYLNFGGAVSGDTGYGIRDNNGVIEKKDEGGSWSAFGESATSWITYVTNGLYTGTTTTIGTGDVLTYDYNGDTVYRHITTAVDGYGYPSEDAFYSTFSGGVLSGLIVARG